MSHLRRELGMFVALVLMCLGLWVSNPDFLSQSNVVNTTRQMAHVLQISLWELFRGLG